MLSRKSSVTISFLLSPSINAPIPGPLNNLKNCCRTCCGQWRARTNQLRISPLSPGECQDMLRMLEGDVYSMPHICRYLLIRLDTQLSEGVATYAYQTVTIEHVL